MVDTENQEVVDVVETVDAVIESTEVQSDDIVTQLKQIQEELDSKKELIKQLRKYERQQKEEKEQLLKEQGNYKQLYEETFDKLNRYESQLKEDKINKAIENAAKDSGVKSLPTLMKLIDRSLINVDEQGNIDEKSINKIISDLQKSDAILFELPEVNTPPVKRASDDTNVSTYETELRKAKTNKEIEAVLKKYGKL